VASVLVPLGMIGPRGDVSGPAAPSTIRNVPPASADSPSRITIIAIDGASLRFITNATAEGRLPNFGRILDPGAAMHLATLLQSRSAALRIHDRGALHIGVPSGVGALEHLEQLGAAGRRGELAADVSRARGARLYRERLVLARTSRCVAARSCRRDLSGRSAI